MGRYRSEITRRRHNWWKKATLQAPWYALFCFGALAGCGQQPGIEQTKIENVEERSQDLRQIIADGIASGTREIVIPPGCYRVVPQNREHLLLRGLKDVTIIADGVEMVCTETTRAITIEDCTNLTLRGLSIDYDPLPFTQAVITAISEDKSRWEVEFLAGYPEPGDTTGSVEIFDPSTNRLKGRVTYYGTRTQSTGPRKGTVQKSGNQAIFANEAVGDLVVIKTSHAPGGEIPHAIMSTASTNLTFENVTLFAANSFGFFENGCDGSKYLGCRVERRTPASDPVRRSHPRVRSLNADAYHSKNAQRGPQYERCVAFHMGDDAIAINGDFHMVMGGEGSQLRVLAKHRMTMQAGDEVQIFEYDGTRLANRKILSIEPEGSRDEADNAFLAKQNMNDRLRDTALKEAYRVVLDEPVDVPVGTLICSADRIGNGFAIRDCHLGFNRSRGILVKSGRGEITGNHLEGSAMTAILVSPEYWWLEAGLSDDLVISGNKISDGGGMGIAVVAVGGNGSLAPSGAFRNIIVRDNQIQGGASPGMLLASIEGLVDVNNSVETDASKTLNSWEIGAWGQGGVQAVMLPNSQPAPQTP